jgi:hypothetical protein
MSRRQSINPEDLLRSSLRCFRGGEYHETPGLAQRTKITLPPWWTKQETLRWCFSSHFEFPKALDNAINHISWITNPEIHRLTPAGKQVIDAGIMYQYGRDSKFRPVVIINVFRIDPKKHAQDAFINALTYLLDTVRAHMFLPGFVENWIILLETQEMSLWDIPIGYIRAVISMTQAHFPSTMHKLYILNPSFILNASWSIVKAMIDPETSDKIAFVKKSKFSELQEFIPANQLEKRFGGLVPEITSYWPLVNTLED